MADLHEDYTREPTDLTDCEQLLRKAQMKVQSLQMQLGQKPESGKSDKHRVEWRNRLKIALSKTVERVHLLKDIRREFLQASRLTVGNNLHTAVLADAFNGFTKVRDVVYALTEEVKQLSSENAALRARLAEYETPTNYDPPTMEGHDHWRDGCDLPAKAS